MKATGAGSCPGTVSALTDLSIEHIWVKVKINGSWYVFDPSYKPHTFKSGIDLASSSTTGYDAASYLARPRAAPPSRPTTSRTSTGPTSAASSPPTPPTWRATCAPTSLRPPCDVLGGKTITLLLWGPAPERAALPEHRLGQRGTGRAPRLLQAHPARAVPGDRPDLQLRRPVRAARDPHLQRCRPACPQARWCRRRQFGHGRDPRCCHHRHLHRRLPSVGGQEQPTDGGLFSAFARRPIQTDGKRSQPGPAPPLTASHAPDSPPAAASRTPAVLARSATPAVSPWR